MLIRTASPTLNINRTFFGLYVLLSLQRLLVFLRFQIATSFSSVEDQLEKTVDYAGVASEVEGIVESSQAQLMEKLVIDIGEALLERFPMRRLEIELRKFILPNTRYVSVRSDWQR